MEFVINQITHLSALYPLYVSFKYSIFEFLFLIPLVVFISMWHHLEPSNNTLTLVDEISSCFLILFSIFVFMMHRPALLLFGLVIASLGLYTDMLIPSLSISFALYAAIVVMTETFDIYLILSLGCQVLSALAFVLDVHPVSHGVWHVAAFISLGFIIEHVVRNPPRD